MGGLCNYIGCARAIKLFGEKKQYKINISHMRLAERRRTDMTEQKATHFKWDPKTSVQRCLTDFPLPFVRSLIAHRARFVFWSTGPQKRGKLSKIIAGRPVSLPSAHPIRRSYRFAGIFSRGTDDSGRAFWPPDVDLLIQATHS